MDASPKIPLTEGCPYFDEDVYNILLPRQELRSPIARAACEVVGTKPPERIDEFVGVQRVKLRWMEPDGKGGVRPKRQKGKWQLRLENWAAQLRQKSFKGVANGC